jgi:hypothetical protein
MHPYTVLVSIPNKKANAAPVVSNELSDCDAANLLHMSLGHMNELGLAE